MNSTIEQQNAAPTGASEPKAKHARKKAKTPKKVARAKKNGKQKADRSNKKAEVIAMLRRTKGATLAEIMAAMKWQAHTVRGFVSILGSKGGEKIESSRSESGERTYCIARSAQRYVRAQFLRRTRPPCAGEPLIHLHECIAKTKLNRLMALATVATT